MVGFSELAEFIDVPVVILVSHSPQTIEEMCDRVCLLVRGRLDAEGHSEQVVARYREVRGGGHALG